MQPGLDDLTRGLVERSLFVQRFGLVTALHYHDGDVMTEGRKKGIAPLHTMKESSLREGSMRLKTAFSTNSISENGFSSKGTNILHTRTDDP